MTIRMGTLACHACWTLLIISSQSLSVPAGDCTVRFAAITGQARDSSTAARMAMHLLRQHSDLLILHRKAIRNSGYFSLLCTVFQPNHLPDLTRHCTIL